MADRKTGARIVVTGMGLVSPLGANVDAVWKRLIGGQSGIRRLDDEIVPDIDCKVAGVVPDIAEDPEGFDLGAAVPAKDRKKMDRFIQFAIEASGQALAQAGWAPQDEVPRERTATVIASVTVRPAGSLATSTPMAVAMPAKMTASWYFWVTLTASLPPATV